MKHYNTTSLTSVVIIVISILVGQACPAQDIVKRFNELLPPSIPVRGPEFDAEKKHLLSIDSAHNFLHIQVIGKNPTTKKSAIDKLVYEIPMRYENVLPDLDDEPGLFGIPSALWRIEARNFISHDAIFVHKDKQVDNDTFVSTSLAISF